MGRNGRLFLAVFMAFFMATAVARAASVFTISDIAVDVTAETASAARDAALVAGQIKARQRLLERMTARSDHGRLPMPTGARLAELIAAFEVGAEKTSSVRYLANLTVHFKPEAVRSLLRSANIPFAETAARPVLVLPVYMVAGAPSLWDELNPWRAAWLALPARDSLAPVIVPISDLADIGSISADQALAGDAERLAEIRDRYGAGSVLIVVATVAADGAQLVLTLQADWRGALVKERTLVESVAVALPADLSSAFGAAAQRMADWVEESWKQDNFLRFDQEAELTAIVPITGMADWLEIRRLLAGVAILRRGTLFELSRTEARIGLSYLGSEEQLSIALAQQNLSLTKGPTSWLLSRRPSPPAR